MQETEVTINTTNQYQSAGGYYYPTYVQICIPSDNVNLALMKETELADNRNDSLFLIFHQGGQKNAEF